jgi:hypothetical protein
MCASQVGLPFLCRIGHKFSRKILALYREMPYNCIRDAGVQV